MSEATKTNQTMDPTELWKQWNEMSSKMWSNVMDGAKETYVDPYGLYRSWMKNVSDSQEQLKTASSKMLDPGEVWKQWFETTTQFWGKAAEMGGDPLGLSTQWQKMMEETRTKMGGDPLGLMTRWQEMLEEARSKMQAGESLPTDPFTFFKQWYDTTSEQWAQAVGDLIGTDTFMEYASQFMENYSSVIRASRHANEEYFRNLQLPTRSDIARVASLVVSLEEKVDRIEDAFEDLQDSRSSTATTEAVAGLDARLDRLESKLETFSSALETHKSVEGLTKRLDRVESKLDTILTALEKLETQKAPATVKPIPKAQPEKQKKTPNTPTGER